jgi:hypothetical protein
MEQIEPTPSRPWTVLGNLARGFFLNIIVFIPLLIYGLFESNYVRLLSGKTNFYVYRGITTTKTLCALVIAINLLFLWRKAFKTDWEAFWGHLIGASIPIGLMGIYWIFILGLRSSVAIP